jgi:Rnl2 family RNA ligase
MSDFIRWVSIENSYQQKNIDWWLEHYPELANETFSITEKLHGSNWQWFIQPHESIKAGSRNQWLDMKGSFNGVKVQDMVELNKSLLQYLQERADEENETIRLFGELFGGNIQKGVDYGSEKRILYFGCMVNDELLSFADFQTYVLPNEIVPVIAYIHGLENALKYDPAFDSRILSIPDNLCEGIVIMPRDKVYQEQGTFILKIKNEAFKEKSKAKKPVIVDSEVNDLHTQFLRFVNDNRLQSVFSKYGEIESKQQIGNYLRYLIDDAKEDFMKEFADEFEQLDKGQQRAVFNVGSVGFKLLQKYL